MHSPIHQASEDGLDELVAEGFEGVVVKDVNSSLRLWRTPSRLVQDQARRGDRGDLHRRLPSRARQQVRAADRRRAAAVGRRRDLLPRRASGRPDLRGPGGRHGRPAAQRTARASPSSFVGLVVELHPLGSPGERCASSPKLPAFPLTGRQAAPPKAGRTRRNHPATDRRHRRARLRSPPAASAACATTGRWAMPKLLRSIESLRSRTGEAYEKCMNAGSGDPAKDLSVAEGIARGRGYDQGRTS